MGPTSKARPWPRESQANLGDARDVFLRLPFQQARAQSWLRFLSMPGMRLQDTNQLNCDMRIERETRHPDHLTGNPSKQGSWPGWSRPRRMAAPGRLGCSHDERILLLVHPEAPPRARSLRISPYFPSASGLRSTGKMKSAMPNHSLATREFGGHLGLFPSKSVSWIFPFEFSHYVVEAFQNVELLDRWTNHGPGKAGGPALQNVVDSTLETNWGARPILRADDLRGATSRTLH
ncbi:hypothetical protein BJY00DRAFT_94648 [Aspergillus carlsbadensis]|nr:hypothetical protein BJY00DRAFT_94648 [Aspergillus carlsbadensis]